MVCGVAELGRLGAGNNQGGVHPAGTPEEQERCERGGSVRKRELVSKFYSAKMLDTQKIQAWIDYLGLELLRLLRHQRRVSRLLETRLPRDLRSRAEA